MNKGKFFEKSGKFFVNKGKIKRSGGN